MGGGEVVGVELVALYVGLGARVTVKAEGLSFVGGKEVFDIPCDRRGVSQRAR